MPEPSDDLEPVRVCAECWVAMRGQTQGHAIPVFLREREPCVRCGFITDSGLVATVQLVRAHPRVPGIIEATCQRCGEVFNPADENDTTHVARADGTECGGYGPITGVWVQEIAFFTEPE